MEEYIDYNEFRASKEVLNTQIYNATTTRYIPRVPIRKYQPPVSIAHFQSHPDTAVSHSAHPHHIH